MGLNTVVLGSRRSIAGTVYGTIVVLAVLAAGAEPYKHHLWRLVAIAGTSVLVLWAAHVYAHGLGESLDRGHRLGADELAAVARRELAIPLAAVVPLAFVALAALGVLSNGLAIALAFGSGVATLAVQGLRYARLERLSRTATVLTVAVNLGLGLVIVALETAVAH